MYLNRNFVWTDLKLDNFVLVPKSLKIENSKREKIINDIINNNNIKIDYKKESIKNYFDLVNKNEYIVKAIDLESAVRAG